ncbi:UPF0158 family protein [Anaerobacillus isosaccharinicus]|uniref:Uncharacterized protein n=1 Tax=Anaerobacillus isosaccharinicus TaxID=1532552 RepID=A0A1S2L791_9BACI|nr:UPF0158 family protein [Anaerobacillus isosaccharinicus]MBA5585064.1 hypothetical protein [Anaerobacillus isosaccharinicus]QOY36590.1 hypothetical protein AWH56_002610 [Anaerobacillus isosaccharinicus]
MEISKEILEELVNCYDDNQMDHEYFLNIETKDIAFVSSYIDRNEYDELMEKVEEGFGEIYFKVPQTDSREGFLDMEEFVETVYSDKAKSQLYDVLSRNKGVFRRFKDVLMEYCPQSRKLSY